MTATFVSRRLPSERGGRHFDGERMTPNPDPDKRRSGLISRLSRTHLTVLERGFLFVGSACALVLIVVHLASRGHL